MWTVACGANCMAANATKHHMHDYSGKVMDTLLLGLYDRKVQCQALAQKELSTLSFSETVGEVQRLEVARD